MLGQGLVQTGSGLRTRRRGRFQAVTIQIPDFSKTHVVVAGDVMLDRYLFGSTGRISPEAPVPVVHVQETDNRPGGAANVALNLASLGISTCLLGVVGEDSAAETLKSTAGAARNRLQVRVCEGSPDDYEDACAESRAAADSP